MEELLSAAADAAAALRERRETIGVCESSSGGLLAASLLAQPGASSYFLGSGVVYTKASMSGLLGITSSDMTGIRPLTEEHSIMLADKVRARLGATWGLAEFGAAGPSATRYGNPPGGTFLGLVGPLELSRAIETGSDDRVANMRAFAAAALDLLNEALAR